MYRQGNDPKASYKIIDRSGGMEDGKSIHTNAGMQC